VRITKFGHACVRLESDGRVLVIDPGIWTESAALDGADAVLLTHEHDDHVDAALLSGRDVPVFAPDGADLAGLGDGRVTRVRAGEQFTAAGWPVRAVGGRHAFIVEGQPDCANLGYVVDGAAYHPGDALHVPDEAVTTVFVPMQGSWLKTCEAIDFVNAIGPDRAFGIHDGQLNERGLDSISAWLAEETTAEFRYLAPGESA
jgi:L-ascorbate metabolism protein UlaG (beta-lactamase superfamily)